MNFRNRDKVQEAYDYMNDRISGFYGSSMYSNFYDRCENREKAYYLTPASSAPVWRSKLYFAVFLMGCKSLEAQFDQSLRNDPIVQVGLEEGRGYDPAVLKKAETAHFDLNHDLYLSRFREINGRIQWYATVMGTGVGREFFATEAKEREQYAINYNMFGEQEETLSQIISRHEHTVTEAVDPRNFAHNPQKSEFWQSRWSSVRYPLPVSDIYEMLGDDRYYQPGVKELIKKIEGSKEPQSWSKGKSTYYTRNDDDTRHQNSVIVDEYSGDMNMSGNRNDNTLYYGLICRAHNIVLALRESPFRRHPYWKERPYPDPTGPWGIDPCAMLLPVGYLKNNIVNQMVDMVNTNLKYMYEVYAGSIMGGASQLISGLPGGLILADSKEDYQRGPLVRPVNKDKAIPYVTDLINYIDKYETEMRPASKGRGKESATDTATEIGFMAQREDNFIALQQERIDRGIEDAMAQKMENRTSYATQPMTAQVGDADVPITYFPRELGGEEYTYKMHRVAADVQAGKYISYMKLVAQGLQMGIVEPSGMARLMRTVGRNLGIDETDQIVKVMQPGQAPQIPGQAPQSPGQAPMGQPSGVPESPQPQQPIGAAANVG